MTGLRGVAALWVVGYHALAVKSPSNWIQMPIDNGYLAVDLFFVLSGYVMALNYGTIFTQEFRRKDYLAFLGKRLARTYPLYVAATLAALFCEEHFGSRSGIWPGQTCGAAALLPNVLLVQNWNTPFCSIDPPGWSISAEWGAYILFPLLCQVTLLGARSRLRVITIVSIITLSLVSLVPKALLGQPGGPWPPLGLSNGITLAPGLRCLAGFTLGLISYRFAEAQTHYSRFTGSRASLIVASGLFLLLLMRGVDLVIVTLFPFLIISLSRDSGLVSRLLSAQPIYYIGQISYSIYLVHFPILIFLRNIGVFSQSDYNFAATGATGALTLLVATLTYFLIERPGRDVLNRAIFRMSFTTQAT